MTMLAMMIGVGVVVAVTTNITMLAMMMMTMTMLAIMMMAKMTMIMVEMILLPMVFFDVKTEFSLYFRLFQKGVSNVAVTIADGRLDCTFTRQSSLRGNDNTYYSLSGNNKYTIIMAKSSGGLRPNGKYE